MLLSQNNSDDDVSLFDPEMLSQLDWDSKTASFKNGCSPSNPGESLEMRPLRLSDYHRGKIQCYESLFVTCMLSKCTIITVH